MKLLVDYHHADLAESLRLLFADRFGWTVAFPYGMEWWDSGIWQHEKRHHGDAVARQYLLGVWPDVRIYSDHVEADDPTHPGRVHYGLTLDQARAAPPDVVMASLPDNEAGLHHFARSIGAKYGVQIGNQWQATNWEWADFGLVSATLEYVPTKPHVIYHQEFSLNDFRFEYPPSHKNNIASFIQCFPENPQAYQEFMQYARLLPNEFFWQVYGAYGSHPLDEFACGNLPSTPDVATAMRATRIAWHTKQWSDGYGHVIHNLFAVGRPVVGRASYYTDKLAGALWEHGVTSFNVDAMSREETVATLRRLRDDDEYHWTICEQAHARFLEVVSFDEDANRIMRMLEGVL